MVYVVIPNYNGKEHLPVCIDSLKQQDYKNFKIVLVDNASEDDSVKFVKETYPEVTILEMKFNTGFSKSVNEGIKFSMNNPETDYIVLLNNDTECDKHFISELLRGFKEESIGSVACKMLNFYQRKKIDDAGDFIKRKGSPYARGFEEMDEAQYDQEEYIFGACAGAAIYRKEVFEKLGLFDEDFFAYYEDIDFSFRMQIAGYKCLYNPKALCYHKRGATTGSKAGFQTMLCEKNLVAVRIKNYPMWTLIKSVPFFLAVRILRYYRFYRDHSPQLFWSAVKGYLRGLRELPKSLKKRREIQKKRKVSTKYLESIFR